MKTKLYYIILLWLLCSCTPSGGISTSYYKGRDNIGNKYYILLVDKHEYIKMSNSLTHNGACKQCKFELDSIVKNAINEAFEANLEENWNDSI